MLVRAAIAVGIILGIACVASVSIVVGAVLGTIAGYASEAVTNALTPKPSSEEHVTVEVK